MPVDGSALGPVGIVLGNQYINNIWALESTIHDKYQTPTCFGNGEIILIWKACQQIVSPVIHLGNFPCYNYSNSVTTNRQIHKIGWNF